MAGGAVSMSFVLAVVTGGLAMYLLLPPSRLPVAQRCADFDSSVAIRRAGAGLGVASLVLFSFSLSWGVDWPVRSRATNAVSTAGDVAATEMRGASSKLDSWVALAAFTGAAGASIAFAVLAITGRIVKSAATWFALLAAAVGVLYLLVDAGLLLCCHLLVFGATAGGLYRMCLPGEDRAGSLEPLVACLAGALFILLLCGAIHNALTVEAARTVAAEEQRMAVTPGSSALPADRVISAFASLDREQTRPPIGDFRLLHHVLIVAAILFAVGSISFVARRNVAAIILSLGVMLQGLALAVTAASAFHGSAAGELFALAILGTAVVHIALLSTAGFLFARQEQTLDISCWQELRDPALPAESVGEEPDESPQLASAPSDQPCEDEILAPLRSGGEELPATNGAVTAPGASPRGGG